MNQIKKVFIIAFFTAFQLLNSDSVITLFLQPYPEVKINMDKAEIDHYSRKLKQPGYLLKKVLPKAHKPTGIRGIMCMYLGYIDVSNYDGKITFPRKQQKPELYILITKKIKPVFMVAPDTINNWMIDEETVSQMYKLSLKHDKETELFYIDAKKTELPKNYMIPLNTIIIIANPKNIVIPEGATITSYSANLILPNVYIKKYFNYPYNALYTLSIKQYFGSMTPEYKQEDQTISTIIK